MHLKWFSSVTTRHSNDPPGQSGEPLKTAAGAACWHIHCKKNVLLTPLIYYQCLLLCNSWRLLWTSSRRYLWSWSQSSLLSGHSKRRELEPDLQYLGAQRTQTHSVYCGPDHSERREQCHCESREQITVNTVNWPAVKTGNKLTVLTGHFFTV